MVDKKLSDDTKAGLADALTKLFNIGITEANVLVTSNGPEFLRLSSLAAEGGDIGAIANEDIADLRAQIKLDLGGAAVDSQAIVEAKIMSFIWTGLALAQRALIAA